MQPPAPAQLRLRGALLLCLLSSSALAVQYETEIDIRAELDLQDLYEQGEIGEDTLDALIELLRSGVDLNSATREELYTLPNLTYADVDGIISYRTAQKGIADPLVLVRGGIIDAGKLEKIAAFIVVYPPGQRAPLNGSVRLVSRYTLRDPVAPPAYLQARLRGPYDLTGGVMLLTTRYVLGPVGYDAARDALSVHPERYGLQLPRFFLRWRSGHADVFAGTYRIGFGERTTLDTTNRYTPEGFYYDDSVRALRDLTSVCRRSSDGVLDGVCEGQEDQYATPDFTLPQTFRGVAAALRELELGQDARASLYAFGSFQERSIYQYQLYDRAHCADPRNEEALGCAAPSVYIRDDSQPFAPTPRVSFSTLPGIFHEAMGGAHGTLTLFNKWELGVTGYYAKRFSNTPGIDLDVQEWSQYVFGGPYGAIGLDSRISVGDVSFFAEVTRSFDSIPSAAALGVGDRNGGGFAALQRTVYGTKTQELELTLRYYDREFVNPYARSIAAPDMYDGQRERNEAGARLKYTSRLINDLKLRASLDFWVLPEDAERPGTAGTPNLYALLRADYEGWRVFKVAAWVDYRNKDVRSGGHGQCYADGESTVDGEPQGCTGDFYKFSTRMKVTPHKRVVFTGLYSHALMDDPSYPTSFRQDRTVWVEARVFPLDELALRARARWYSQDIANRSRLEESVWGLFDVTWTPSRRFTGSLRYDLFRYIDQRASTLARSPNPEHRFRLELESRF
ncbi:MAG: ComEA family DNA-binding protein [Myxococcaceae bacterium]